MTRIEKIRERIKQKYDEELAERTLKLNVKQEAENKAAELIVNKAKERQYLLDLSTASEDDFIKEALDELLVRAKLTFSDELEDFVDNGYNTHKTSQKAAHILNLIRKASANA